VGAPPTGASPDSGTRGAGPPRAAAVAAAEASALVVVLLWGINFVVIKAAIGVMPPLGLTFLRFASAGLILLLFVRLREGRVRWPPGTGRPLLVLGAIGFGAYQVLWVAGLRLTTAGTSAILVAATPIFTVLFAAASGFERWHRARILGAAIAFLGVAFVAGGNGLDLRAAGLGDLLTVAAAACWGFYLAMGAPYLSRMSPLLQSAWVVLAGSAVLAPPGLAELAGAGSSWIAPGPILAIAYSAIFAVAAAQVLLLRAVRVLGPSRVSNLQFLVPVVTVILGALLLGEPVLPAQMVGGLLIVVGILVARRAPLHRPDAPGVPASA
jgi:drug/metabolite transporter (DMT)-like permease